ncbi:MAG: hypothetical protein LBO21_03735 [Synergistaceae bacterium]|jgi:hypothetical protein|nr:hypothetical protein [Synergistaceae bacterium]
MNIQSVSKVRVQDSTHQSAFVYGMNREYLPPRQQQGPTTVVVNGEGHLDTNYQFRSVAGWLGDVPATFTYLMAYRSYEYTKQVFSHWDRRFATTDTNSWII